MHHINILFVILFTFLVAVASKAPASTRVLARAQPETYGTCIAGVNGIIFHSQAGCCRQIPANAHLLIQSVNGPFDISYRTNDGDLNACIDFNVLQSSSARVFLQTTNDQSTLDQASIVIGVDGSSSFAYVQSRPDDVRGQDGTQTPYTITYPVSSMFFDGTFTQNWTNAPRSAKQVAYGTKYAPFNVRFCAGLCIPDCTAGPC